MGDGSKVHRRQKIPNSAVEVESYSNAERYIVITGNPLPNTWPHVAGIGPVMADLVAELDGNPSKPNETAGGLDFGGETGAFLPSELRDLIENPVPLNKDHSGEFHHAVCWLKDCGWSAARIEAYITNKPIVPERFKDRLAGEIARCFQKAKSKDANDREQPKQQTTLQPLELLWHGDKHNQRPRQWLVNKLLPETGSGLRLVNGARQRRLPGSICPPPS